MRLYILEKADGGRFLVCLDAKPALELRRHSDTAGLHEIGIASREVPPGVVAQLGEVSEMHWFNIKGGPPRLVFDTASAPGKWYIELD